MWRNTELLFIVTFLALLFRYSGTAHEQPGPLAKPTPGVESRLSAASVRMDQRLGISVPGSATFKDESGRTVRLQDFFGSSPVILVFAYYECPHLCTLVLNGLSDAIKNLPLKLGTDFKVLTISIDPREKPPLALMKQRTYLAQLGLTPEQGAAGPDAGWRFLTGEEEQIRTVTEAAGFHYAWDPASKEYAHPTGIIILTPEGKISRYFPGVQFPLKELRLALVDASTQKIGSVTDRLFLTCFHYDPQTGKYSLTIVNVLRILGGITVLVLVAGLIILSRKPKKGQKA